MFQEVSAKSQGIGVWHGSGRGILGFSNQGWAAGAPHLQGIGPLALSQCSPSLWRSQGLCTALQLTDAQGLPVTMQFGWGQVRVMM